jgi:hypothetical protein
MDEVGVRGEFRYIPVRPNSRRKLGKLSVGPVSQEHHAGLSQPIRVTHHLHEQAAIEPRHVDVDKDDVGLGLSNRVKAAKRAMVKTRKKSHALETANSMAAKCRVVVNDEHSVHVPPANGSMRKQFETRCVVRAQEQSLHSRLLANHRPTACNRDLSRKLDNVRSVVKWLVAKAERLPATALHF